MNELNLEVEVKEFVQEKSDQMLKDSTKLFKNKIVDGRGSAIGLQVEVKEEQ